MWLVLAVLLTSTCRAHDGVSESVLFGTGASGGDSGGTATNGTTAGGGGADLSSLFGGLTLTDVVLLSAIAALIVVLLGVMAIQRHRAQRHLDVQTRQRHEYAAQSLRAQTGIQSV